METNFENFYDKIDKTDFEESWKSILKSKKKAMKITIIISIIINVIETILFMGFFEDEEHIFQYILILLFFYSVTDLLIIVFVQALRSYKNDIKYSELYKNSLIGGMLNNFYSDVNYHPYEGITRNIYDSGLYNELYNCFESDDFAEMMFKEKCLVKLAEVCTVYERKYRNSTTRITKFHGLFAQIFLPKSIGCNLRIRMNQFFKQYNEIEMDYAEFEKMFDVDTDNRIKAMQILTHDVMEELINFKKNTNCDYDVFVKENILYIRLHTGQIFESVIDKKEVVYKNTAHRYFNILKFLYNLSDKLLTITEEDKI